MRIIICSNSSWNLYNYRLSLMLRLRQSGHEVIAITSDSKYKKNLNDLGFDVLNIPLHSHSINFFKDFYFLFFLVKTLNKFRPDLYLGYTIKPNLYGALAARILGIKCILTVTGLGSAYNSGGFIGFVIKKLYKCCLSKATLVFFQNQDDCNEFIKAGLVCLDVARVVNGSGVDTNYFKPDNAKKEADEKIKFLLVARLLSDKGIFEFVDAAKVVSKQFNYTSFFLLGQIDPKNPMSISAEQVDLWVKKGLICYSGHVNDVRPEIAEASCIVLPSYREGLPRALLEAASMGKPIIATDVPGCRSVVENGVNGLLCRPRDFMSLANSMIHFIVMKNELKLAMGRAGRSKVEREFSDRIVISQYLEAISSCEKTS